jgi:HSP20 family protein
VLVLASWREQQVSGRRRRPRPQGSFTRQLSLGEGVDSENLTAAYADGVLHLTIPVSPKTQARRVEITHAPGGSHTISGSTAEPGGAPADGTGGG